MRRNAGILLTVSLWLFALSGTMVWAGPTFPYNVTPDEAVILVEEAGAVILDVRTSPEYALIGHPKWTDSKGASHEAVNVPFFFFGIRKGDIYNPQVKDSKLSAKYGEPIWRPRLGNLGSVRDFLKDVKKAVPDKCTPVIVMCRSGQRSCWAAYYLVDSGYSEVYNMLGGFEGDKANCANAPDIKASWYGQRGIVNGWQADNPNFPEYCGLPYSCCPGYTRKCAIP